MEPSLERLVRAEWRDLLDDGRLRVVESESDQPLGNAFVTMAAPGFFVRVVRDRGEVYADVASGNDPSNWYPLHLAIAAAERNEPAEPRLLGVAEHAEGLKRSWPKLVSAFASWVSMREALAQARQITHRRFLERLPPGSRRSDDD